MSEITSDSLNRDLIRQLNAEIERLKKVISLDAVAIGNKNRIISQLCDAFGRYKLLWDGDAELLQRARKASK